MSRNSIRKTFFNRLLEVQSQKTIPVWYEDRNVGDFVADLIVEDKVIVDLKSVQCLIKAHEVQLVNYLVATGLPVGLLINFGETGTEVRRKVRQLLSRKGTTIHRYPPSCNPV